LGSLWGKDIRLLLESFLLVVSKLQRGNNLRGSDPLEFNIIRLQVDNVKAFLALIHEIGGRAELCYNVLALAWIRGVV
jgi:hypothetical protein